MFEFYQSQNLVSQYLKLIYHRGENPRHGAEMKGGGEGVQSTGGEHFGSRAAHILFPHPEGQEASSDSPKILLGCF